MSNREITLPGKVFIIGEYAVLDGNFAWVAAVPPRFRFEKSSGDSARNDYPSDAVSPFHVDSPAGRLLRSLGPTKKAQVEAELARGKWTDAWAGRGGFGGSTAEFGVVAALSGIRDPREAHARYLELFPAPRRPSGADLVAQWVGGTIEWEPVSRNYKSRTREFAALPVVLFSATHLPQRKTRTYAHLETVDERPNRFESLVSVLELARASLDSGDVGTLGSALSRYAEALHDLGLEAESAHSDRLALSERPGVLGAKGCGALQTDALVVLLESFDHADSLIEYAESALDLRLLSRGLSEEPGLDTGGEA